MSRTLSRRSRKSFLILTSVLFMSLLLTNRFLFNDSWNTALKGSIFVAGGSMVVTALVSWVRRIIDEGEDPTSE